jgi:hypothetical protein
MKSTFMLIQTMRRKNEVPEVIQGPRRRRR